MIGGAFKCSKYAYIVCVHSDGVGRTGSFSIIYAGMQQINQGQGLPDIPDLVRGLRRKRKHMVAEQHQLRFCYHAVLYHAQDILMKSKLQTRYSFAMFTLI